MYPREYIQFLTHFHGDRDYFECHEILEEYWKESNNRTKDSIWVGFILLAVSRYHHRRANYKGAKRTLEKAIKIFSIRKSAVTNLGLDNQILSTLLYEQLLAIEKEESYKSFNLPICDPILLESCLMECNQKGFIWGNVSHLADLWLVHRHKLRDRTSVVQERFEAIKARKGIE